MAISKCSTIKSQAYRATMAVGRVAYRYRETRAVYNVGAAMLSAAGRIFSNSIENGKMRRELDQRVPIQSAKYLLKGESPTMTINNVGALIAFTSGSVAFPCLFLQSMGAESLDTVLKISGWSYGLGAAMVIIGQAIHYGIDSDNSGY